MDDPTSYRGKLVQAPRFYKQWWLAGNPADFFEMLSDRFGDFVQNRGLFNFYLVMVGQRFRLKINPNQPHAMEAKLTMQLRGGLEVQLERRT